jgi:hypothetical protein
MSRPNRRPTSQPGQPGSCTQPITNPIAKRLANAPSNAVVLSGKDIGSIRPTSSAPNAIPAIKPRMTFDMWNGLAETVCAHNISRELDCNSQSISASIEGIIPEKAADWQANVPDSGPVIHRHTVIPSHRHDRPAVAGLLFRPLITEIHSRVWPSPRMTYL